MLTWRRVIMDNYRLYQVKARDAKGNTSILHEVQEEQDAVELEEWERLRNPDHYLFVDISDYC
jgi:hypothetical protein